MSVCMCVAWGRWALRKRMNRRRNPPCGQVVRALAPRGRTGSPMSTVMTVRPSERTSKINKNVKKIQRLNAESARSEAQVGAEALVFPHFLLCFSLSLEEEQLEDACHPSSREVPRGRFAIDVAHTHLQTNALALTYCGEVGEQFGKRKEGLSCTSKVLGQRAAPGRACVDDIQRVFGQTVRLLTYQQNTALLDVSSP